MVQLRSVGRWDQAAAVLQSPHPNPNEAGAWKGDPREAKPLTFSEDGKYLATGEMGNDSVFVWQIESQTQIAHLQHQRLASFRFHPTDSNILVTAGEDNTARVWSVTSKRELSRLTHRGPVRAVGFSPDGKWLATASEDKTARLWEVVAEPEVVRLTDTSVGGIWFDHSARCLLMFSGQSESNGTVSRRCWDTRNSPVERLPAEETWSSVTFSADGKFFASARQESAAVWETNGLTELARLAHEPPLDWGNIGERWRQRGVSLREIPFKINQLQQQGSVKVVGISDDGRYIATTRADDLMRIWDVKAEREILHAPTDGYVSVVFGPKAVAMSSDPKWMAEEESAKAVRIWQLPEGRELKPLKHPARITRVLFSPNGHSLVTASADEYMRVWNLKEAREALHLKHWERTPPLLLSQRGKYVAIMPEIDHIQVRDAVTGGKVTDPLPVDASTLAFSPDEQYFAIGTVKSNVILYELPGGKRIGDFAHAGRVLAIHFSTDGKHFATGSEDALARIFNIADKREVGHITHESSVHIVRFSPDPTSRYVATADNSTVRVSYWRREDLIAEACRRVPYGLSPEDWQHYLGNTPPFTCAEVAPNRTSQVQ
jgi:WD40 repeat protein